MTTLGCSTYCGIAAIAIWKGARRPVRLLISNGCRSLHLYGGVPRQSLQQRHLLLMQPPVRVIRLLVGGLLQPNGERESR
jgi:hypothetical protein